ncbi:phytochelatin synthase-domain-containing protein [Rhizophagus irregularis DAOM 181602=DAOM 197198]|nr:phytochelatin synthase-domain-containing protein [Rhizophagus irregularis DAOM 181602=DAOM 197198]
MFTKKVAKSFENPQPPPPQITFQGRKLPDHLINLASPSGKELFKQALNESYAEGYFNLSSCFSHQMEPAYCGLSSLSIVLNALQVTGAPVWKGPWRWWYDELLNCCAEIEEVKKSGVTFDQFACLARCHCYTVAKRANKVSKEEFISDLKAVCSRSDIFMIISFSRQALQQTGDGHFSPIGAYNHEQNMALVLDTARFKYPSYFASADLLYEAMLPLDKETNLPRGYFLLSSYEPQKPISLCKLSQDAIVNWTSLGKTFCKDLPDRLITERPKTLEEAVKVILNDPFIMSLHDSMQTDVDKSSSEGNPESGEQYFSTLLNDIIMSPLYSIVKSVFKKQSPPPNQYNETQISFATLFLLSFPTNLFTSLSTELVIELEQYRDHTKMSSVLKHEVEKINEEVTDLIGNFCSCSKTNAILSNDLDSSKADIHFTKAFSISWVYEDLLAHPQYKVVIYENQSIPNSSLEKFAFDDAHTETSRVPTLSQTSSEDNVESKLTSVIMRTATGQPYVCQIPYVVNQTSIEEAPEDNKDVDLMKKGLASLEPLQDNCLYYYHGWWTYEYCHLSHVKQFHTQTIQPNMKPIEDKSVNSYFLGRYDPRHATLPSSYKDKKGSKSQQQQLGTDLQAVGGKKYLVQRWSDGTKCDLTGKPRRVEIQFHCSQQQNDMIAVVTEKFTCHYLVVINTPKLCNDPAFLSKTLNKINHIECRRVISDEKFAQYMDKERKSLESGENEKKMSTEKDDNQHDDEQKVDIRDFSGQETQTDKLFDFISQVAENLKKQKDGVIESDNDAREKPIQIYLMDENGQLAVVDGKTNNEKNEPSYTDYKSVLESLLAQNIKFHSNKPIKKKKSDNYQSHQAKLSLIYEMDYEDEKSRLKLNGSYFLVLFDLIKLNDQNKFTSRKSIPFSEPFSRSRSPYSRRRRSLSPLPTKIMVNKLTKNVTDAHLQEIFGAFGRIHRVEMALDDKWQTNKGIAYIDYETRAEAERAISYMDGGQLDGSLLSCTFVPRRPLSPLPPRRRGGRFNSSPPRRFMAIHIVHGVDQDHPIPEVEVEVTHQEADREAAVEAEAIICRFLINKFILFFFLR